MDATDKSLTTEIRRYWSKFWGVNQLSILNQARFFEVCQCLSHDIMHILFERVVPLEIKFLLRHGIDDLRLFTLKWLNESITNMKLTGLEAKDRPSKIDRSHLNSNGHKLNQSGKYIIIHIICTLIYKIHYQLDI